MSADDTLSSTSLSMIVEQLTLAVFVFRDGRLFWANAAALSLQDRFREKHAIELVRVLHEQLRGGESAPQSRPAPLVTTPCREPLSVQVMPLRNGRETAITVRELGSEIDGFRVRYRLSKREAEVAELVRYGQSNRDIADTLGISTTTIKKHLTHVFDKTGVDSRAQLAIRVASFGEAGGQYAGSLGS